MRSAKEIMESLEIAKGLCEGKTNESWNARKAGRVMAELIAHFKKKEIEEQYDRVQIIATVVISKEDIDDIMVSALEGGITYWVDKVEPRCGIEFNFASDVISKGGSILIHDNEEDATYELTKVKLLQGIRAYAEQPSKKTVRHRLNIAKLDSKTLMEKERQDGYQLSLTDLYELEKIKDVKTRDKILKDSTDSRDLARRAINAQKEQKRQENMKLYVAMMKKLGLKKAPKEADSEFYTDKWERMKDYSLDKEPPKTMKFEDDGEPMFYLERYGTLYVIRKKKKEKKVLTPEEEAKKQNMRNKKQIKAILKEAANTRKAFIEGILSGRIKKVTDEKQVEADLFEQMMDWETFAGHNKLIEFFVGCEVYNAPEEEKEAARKKMQGLSVLQKLLCLVSAMVADADLVEWNYTYNTVKGEKVKAFYGILEQYGFQFPNDEEKGVVEGTSDLYVKKEGAK